MLMELTLTSFFPRFQLPTLLHTRMEHSDFWKDARRLVTVYIKYVLLMINVPASLIYAFVLQLNYNFTIVSTAWYEEREN